MIAEDFADPERAVVDYLIAGRDQMPDDLAGATVGVVLPEDWTVRHPPHLAVAVDGVSEQHAWSRPGPLRATATVRLTAWADTRTRAKALARWAHAAALMMPARPQLGVVATLDPDSRAPIASCTVLMDQSPQH